MSHLKDFMPKTYFYEILCNLDYVHMNESDKKFITNLYEKFIKDKDNMEFSLNSYARLNDIDFSQTEYKYTKNFKDFLNIS